MLVLKEEVKGVKRMRKTESEEIKISVNGRPKNLDRNKMIRITYLVMSLVYICHTVFFGISARFIPTFYGGLMSSVFIAGYCIAAYLIIRKNEDSTLISLLYLVLIYAIPCCWMGISYAFTGDAKPLDYLQFVICISAMVLAVLGIKFYYDNNYKFCSIFAFTSMIISIVGLAFGGVAEITRAVDIVRDNIDGAYAPLVGITFLVEGLGGVIPLIYLFKTV